MIYSHDETYRMQILGNLVTFSFLVLELEKFKDHLCEMSAVTMINLT